MATIAQTYPRHEMKRRRPAGRHAEIYFVKRIDNSRLRREVNSAKSRECLSLLGLGIGVFIFVLLFAWQHFQCVRNGYQIEQLKTQRAALQEWNHQLRLEHASLADPQRIDILARNKLGLTSPAPQQVISLGDGAQTPASADDPEFARNFSNTSGETER